MKRQFSLAQKLILQLSLGAALLWAIGATFAVFIINAELNEAFDQNLRQSAARFLPLLISELDDVEKGELADIDIEYQDEVYVNFFALDKDGTLLFAPADLDEELVIEQPRAGLSTVKSKRYFVLRDANSGIQIVMVEIENERSELILKSIWSLILPLLALIPLMAILIWISVRRTLHPIAQLRREISARNAKDLSATNPQNYPKELAPIAEETNGLLDRLDAALKAERSFAASSAHELRTPIAGALAHVQRLQAELADPKTSKRAREVEQSLQKLARLSERLLQFARLEAGFAKSETVNDLLPIVHLVVGDFEHASTSQDQVNLTIEENASLNADIDVDAFAVVLRNLLENAISYRKGSEPIEILIVGMNTIQVRNHSQTMTPDELNALQKPFERGKAKKAGTGIGLSIVATIIEQVGGTFTISSEPNKKHSIFAATVDFPPSNNR